MQGLVDNATMTDIADAIREKTGEEVELLPEEMPAAIRSIPKVLIEEWVFTLEDNTEIVKKVCVSD